MHDFRYYFHFPRHWSWHQPKKCKHDTVNSFSEDYIPCLYGPLPLKKLFKVRLQSRQLQIHVLNSVQEAYAECFAVHISKFEVLHTSKKTKNIKMLNLLVKNWKLRFWCSLFHFFMWFERFEIWTTKRLSLASCTLKVTKIN